MLKFIAKNRKINVLTEQEGIMLGYINENSVFFPNSNMMFKIEWLEEITDYMRKHNMILFGGVCAYYKILDISTF